MPLLSVRDAFSIGSKFYPQILADITDDPRTSPIKDLKSYVMSKIYSYNPNTEHGLGMFLGGTMGSSVHGTHDISDQFEATSAFEEGMDGMSKENILNYMRLLSAFQPTQIISFKETFIPIVLETTIKNATLFSIKFASAKDGSVAIDFDKAGVYKPQTLWTFKPTTPILSDIYVKSFQNEKWFPNKIIPTKMEEGSIALKINPTKFQEQQTILIMPNDEHNYISINLTKDGVLQYTLKKEGDDYLVLQTSPPEGKDFYGKDVFMTIEVVKNKQRKYDKKYTEEVTIMRTSCPELGFEKIERQPIIWNFRRDTPTSVDSSYARGYAYLPFSAFVGGIDKIIIGGSDEAGKDKFKGAIYQIEIADHLPSGTSDFWSSKTEDAIIRLEGN